ncbi:MAG TPA: hypothetical protein V6C81_19055 [Planktothrix sp.]
MSERLNLALGKRVGIAALVIALASLVTGQLAGAKIHAKERQSVVVSSEPQVKLVSKSFDVTQSKRKQFEAQDFDFGAPFGLEGLHHNHKHAKNRTHAIATKQHTQGEGAEVQVQAGPTVSGNRMLLIGGARRPFSSSEL